MAENKDEQQYDDEPVYHFSDEEMDYELESDVVKEPITKSSFLKRLPNTKRILLGMLVFLILIWVVYRILAPPTQPALTEIKQSPTKAQSAVIKPAPVQNAPLVTTPATATPIAPAPIAPSPALQTSSPAVSNTLPPAAVTTPVPPAPLVSSPPVVTEQPTTAVTVVTETQQMKTLAEKQAQLEEQHTAMVSLIQNEMAQKITDAETQTNLVRGKLDELNRRMNRVETALGKLNQYLEQTGVMTSTAPKTVVEPKISYSVQAIIPGRAWLKSESGETVTVAEGDTLRGLGRVRKIDPYDGVVEVVVGNKVIILSYGANS